MLTLRRNLNGWEWVIVDEDGHHMFMSRSLYAVPSYIHSNDIDAVRVEVEPGSPCGWNRIWPGDGQRTKQKILRLHSGIIGTAPALFSIGGPSCQPRNAGSTH